MTDDTAAPAADSEPGDTQPIDPVDVPRAPTDTQVTTRPVPVIVEEVPVAPRKRRRIWPFVTLGVLVVLLVVAFFVGDAIAKDYARDYIRARIIEVLHLDPSTPVTVDIGTGSVLLQALGGKLDQVDVTASEVTFGELSGAATIHAEGVPLSGDVPTEKLDITFSVAEEDVAVLAGNLSGLPLTGIALEEPEIVASTEFDLFFFTVPVGIGLTPSTGDGQLLFTPTSIRLDDQTISADDLLADPTLGGLARQLLAQQAFCVAEYLPVGLTAVDADVVGSDLVVKVDGDGVALAGPELSTMGTCA